MSETPTEPDISAEDRQDHDAVKPRGQPLLAGVLMFVVGLVAVAAIASSAWFYSETQRDIRRMSTEIAQLRLSAELYGRRAAPTTAVGSVASSEDILNLKNRLAILEDSWRNQTPVTVPGATASLPAAPASSGKALEDCIPQGTRFLISAGETFAVCKSDQVIRLTSIGMNDVVLDSGTSIPTGGSAIMADSNCSVAVFSAGEALSGFAEIRVSC